MLFQLENSRDEDVNKLLSYAKENNLALSLIDSNNDYHLPGKPLREEDIIRLIETGRRSGVISMQDAHKVIRVEYNAH